MSVLATSWVAALLCLALVARARAGWLRAVAVVAVGGCLALAAATVAAGLAGYEGRLFALGELTTRCDARSGAFAAVALLAAAGWLPGRVDPRNLVRVAGASLAIVAADPTTLAAGALLAWVPGLSRTGSPSLPGVGGVALAAVAFGWAAPDAAVPALPGWAGLWLMASGPAVAAWAGWRATRAGDLGSATLWIDRAQAGLVAASLGAALAARGADQTGLAAGASAALLLLVVARAATAVLAARLVARVARGAGSVALDRLGGLAAGMPRTSALAVALTLALAGLPLGADFGGVFLWAEATLGVARIGGAAREAAAAIGLVGLALAWTARAGATLRLSLAFLGRPRSPRAAAAEESGRDVAAWLAGGGAVLLGVAPTLPWRLLRPHDARPALLAALPLPQLALLLLLAGAVVVALRARAPDLRSGGRRLVPAWRDGAAPDPPWLPFGEPRAQAQPANFHGPAPPPWPEVAFPRGWLAGLPSRWVALATGLLALAALLLAGLG